MDVFIRYIVGAEVFKSESGDDAAALLQRSIYNEGCIDGRIVLHSDNGGPMKCSTMQAKMKDLGIVGSRSRPRASNDTLILKRFLRPLNIAPNTRGEVFRISPKCEYG